MKQTRRNEQGFSAVEIILVVVIVGLVAFVGWYVWHAKQNSDKALDAATSTSQNAGPRFKSDKAKTTTPTTKSTATTPAKTQ